MRIMRRMIAVSLVFAACASNSTPPIDTGGGGVATQAPVSVTADMVVDVLGPTTVLRFCRAYEQIGDYETALAAFSSTYHHADPSASEVVDEILSRCA